MGVFSVQVKLKNWQHRFLSDDKNGEDVICNALVDSGAVELALPLEIISQLRLEALDKVRVYAADGGEYEYRIFRIVEVEVEGRTCHVRAIELPHGAEPLLGEVPLEEMDWHISPLQKKVTSESTLSRKTTFTAVLIRYADKSAKPTRWCLHARCGHPAASDAHVREWVVVNS